MKISLSQKILEDISESMRDSGFISNGFGYTLKINDKEVGFLEINFNKKSLTYLIIDFSCDGIMRRTIFGDVWMKYLNS